MDIEDLGLTTGLILMGLFTIIGVSLLLALPTMWLWNWLMPAIFGLSEVTFWQALGLNFLSGILVKGTNITTASK